MKKVLFKRTWPTISRNKKYQGTDTIHFIPKSKVPFGEKTVTYGKIVCDIKPYKYEYCRTLLTVGGNLLDYTGNLSTPTASVATAKCLLKIGRASCFASTNIVPADNPSSQRVLR